MPNNGDINNKFGAYRSLCCDREIVIREGATFPYCPGHANLSTIWKPVEVDVDVVVIDERSKSQSKPAA
jgi:hypothetical protein